MHASRPDKISIRRAIDADASSIIDLIFNIWVNENQFNVKREDFPDLQEIEKQYIDAGGLFLVALRKNKIIGTIACQQLSSHDFVLKRMFVEKSHRGLGIAQLLLETLLEQMAFSKRSGHCSLFLSTKEDLAIAAKKLYLKNGFQTISRAGLPEGFPFFYEDDLFMVKSLTIDLNSHKASV